MKTVIRLFHQVPGLVFLIVILVLSAGCGKAETPLPSPKAPQTANTSAGVNTWDELVKAAQKEGTVNIYATSVLPARTPLSEAFKQRFGIDLEFVMGRSPEVIAKITAERRAGLYLADIGHIGETSSIGELKPFGITVPLPDLLVLPEVKNPQNWMGGRLPFLDKDGHVFMFMIQAFPHVVINTDLVKEADLTSFLDLLNPHWKGKIVFNDPAAGSANPNVLAAMMKTFGREKALDVFRQLATQELAITRDDRLLLEWVARGKYAIGMGYSAALFSEFRRIGTPVKMHSFIEPRHIYGGPGTVTVFSNNPHPKATQVWVNWLLSKEGSTIWSKALEYSSARVDVNGDWLDPDTTPRPADIFPDEEQLDIRQEIRTKLGPQIFGRPGN